MGDATVLAAYAKGQDSLDLYRVQGSASWICYAATIEVGPGWDELNSFTFLNMAHLMLYRRDNGQFAFYPLDGGLSSNSKYLFYRNHAPAASKDFTTVQPFVLATGIVVMGYAFATGAVRMYTLSGVASTPKRERRPSAQIQSGTIAGRRAGRGSPFFALAARSFF